MNLFKKCLLVLCLAISVQPAYGWSWGGVASSVTNFITSSIPSFFSQATNYASEHKTAVVLGAVGLLALTATKYAYGKYNEIKAREEEERLKVEKEQREEEEEAKRKRQEETDRKAREEQRQKLEEQQRLEQQKAQEAEKQKLAEAERQRKIREEEVRKAQEEADRRAKEAELEKEREDARLKALEEEKKLIEQLEADRKAREEKERLEAEKRAGEEEKRLKEQQEAEKLEIERKDRERLQKRLEKLKSEKLAREEKKKLEATQKVQEEQINLKNNIFSESFRAPKKEDDFSDFVKVEDLSDSGVLVKNWKHLLVDAESINNYLSSKFHIGKCQSTEKLSELIADTSDYRDLIVSGAKLVWDIVYTDNIKNNIKYNCDDAYDFYGLNSAQDQSHRHDYLADIIRVCWFMYSFALHKNERFQEGSFVVYDKESRIFNFLLNYVKKVDPKDWNKDDPNNWKKEPVHITYNPYGCCRASTHIIECQSKGNKHYGIDIRFGSEIRKLTLRSAILPAGQTHILFGKVDDDHTFIKMENDGLYYKDGWDQHVEGAFLSIGRKLPIIGDFVSWLFGSDDAPTNKKERMTNEFAQMAKNAGWKIKTINDIVKICKANPAMYHTFMQDIIKKYPIDYKGRIGNEVILDACDLQCSYYYQDKATQGHKNAIEDFVRIRKLIKWFAESNSDRIVAPQIENLVNNLKQLQLPEELSAIEDFINTNKILAIALNFSKLIKLEKDQ